MGLARDLASMLLGLIVAFLIATGRDLTVPALVTAAYTVYAVLEYARSREASHAGSFAAGLAAGLFIAALMPAALGFYIEWTSYAATTSI